MSGFIVYIFKTDAEKLLANAGRRASGSLFGQWTSTGNPVVHVIMGKEEARTEGKRLYEAYRLCNIGEWRTVDRDDRDGRQRIAQTVYYEKQNRTRILILDISNIAGIIPYLFEPVFTQPPTQYCELRDLGGDVELLEGENPFSSVRKGHRNPSQIATMVNPPPSYQQHAPVPRSHDQEWYAPSSQTREVDIPSFQWYSKQKDLQYVIKELKRFADGELDISRDTITSDLTVKFTDKHYRRQWTVKFPSRFPKDGAIVSHKTRSSSGTDFSSLGNPKEPSCHDVHEAMSRIVRHITVKGPVR